MDKQIVREFRKNLRRLEQLITTQSREGAGGHGVTAAQCHCLLAVEQLGRPSQNELAEQLCLDKSTLSRMVEGLVQGGWLLRATDDKDRRVYRIRLTAQGEKTCTTLNACNDDLFGRVLDCAAMAPVTINGVFVAIIEAMLQVKDEGEACDLPG